MLYYLVYDFGFAPTFENRVEKAVIIHQQDYMDIWALKYGKNDQGISKFCFAHGRRFEAIFRVGPLKN